MDLDKLVEELMQGVHEIKPGGKAALKELLQEATKEKTTSKELYKDQKKQKSLQNRLSKIESQIKTLEKLIEKDDQQLSNGFVKQIEDAAFFEAYQKKQKELDKLLIEWEEVQEILDAI